MQNSLEKFQTSVIATFVHNLTNSKFDDLIQKYSHTKTGSLYTHKLQKKHQKHTHTHNNKTRYPLEYFEGGVNISDCKTGVCPSIGVIKNGES